MRLLNKSQLRRLAADYADGRMPSGEYRKRRRELVNAIVDGQQKIRREKPAAHAAVPPDRDPAAPAAGAGVPRRVALIGAVAVASVLLLLWLLWPAPEPVPARPPSVSAPPIVELPRSRTIVESFLALKDFGAPAIASFRDEWETLTEQERRDARDTLWFRSLVRALRDEIKTQKALAGLSGGDAARARVRAAWEFGTYLRVTEQLPAMEAIERASAEAPAPLTTAGETAMPQREAEPIASAAGPPPGSDEPVSPAAADAGASLASGAGTPRPATAADTATTEPVPTSEAGPARAPTGREWLAAQSDAALTLQLFAVNRLDRVEQLMSAHPDLPIQIVATDGAAPRYRVFHGVYATESDAREAFDRLPVAVSKAAGGAIVKSFSVVREDLAARAAPTPAVTGGAHTEDGSYTLQLFASGNRDNAQALVDAFPQLALRLHHRDDGNSPYRVVYGRFGTEDDARAAASSLPGTLLGRIGTPLPKSLQETGVQLP